MLNGEHAYFIHGDVRIHCLPCRVQVCTTPDAVYTIYVECVDLFTKAKHMYM
jgi:hypothetical protein